MTTQTLTITSDGSEVLIQKYYKHSKPINGMIEIGGDFDGGVLSLLISHSGGEAINPWNDLSGNQYITGLPKTVSFDIPVINLNAGDTRIYYTLAGATSPSITLTVADNQ